MDKGDTPNHFKWDLTHENEERIQKEYLLGLFFPIL